MKFTTLLMSSLLMAASSLSADNLVKNGDFSELNNKRLPLDWVVRKSANAACSVKLGELKLSAPDGKEHALVIQKNLALESGKKYLVTCEVKGSDNSGYMVYMEAATQVNGKSKLLSFNAKKFPAPADFKTVRLIYTVPENSNAPYIVLRAFDGDVIFRNVVIEEYVDKSPAGSLIKNGSFDIFSGNMPQFWEVRGKGFTLDSDNEGNFLRLPAGTLAIQRSIPMQGGQNYVMSCKVRSSDADNQLMIYYEWNDGKKLRSRVSPVKNAAAEWSEVTLDLSFPAGGKGAYVVLRSIRGTVEFRDIALVKARD